MYLYDIICRKFDLYETGTDTAVFLICVALCIIVPYLIGSINPSIIISRKKYNEDIRSYGSGNAGTTNTLRTYGKKMAVLILVLDMLKAALALFFGIFLLTRGVGGAIAAIFVVLGHMFPIYYKFKGGKGISSGVGLFWLMLGMANPWFWLAGFGIVLTWPITISATKVGSLCSLSYLAGFGVWQIGMLFEGFGTGNVWVSFCVAFIFMVVAFSWMAHYKNMRCLLSGEEHQTVIIKFKKNTKKEKSV